jgi:5-methylcytosine-specific restriction protein A
MYNEFGKHLSKEEILVNEDKDSSLNDKLRKEKQIGNIEYSTKPIEKVKPKVDKRNNVTYYPRDFKMAQVALVKSNYSCEYDKTHYCFERRKDNTRYTEVHHLIPLCYYEEFDNSLDVPENIVSLCSNCHNWLHYGDNTDVILKPLYEARKELLKAIGADITYEQLKSYYN